MRRSALNEYAAEPWDRTRLIGFDSGSCISTAQQTYSLFPRAEKPLTDLCRLGLVYRYHWDVKSDFFEFHGQKCNRSGLNLGLRTH